MAKLLCVCNPLLDISAEVDPSLLAKYGLKPANAILAEPQHLPLYTELVDQYKVEYLAGGAGQNTARATQWMLNTADKVVHYTGSVGKDEYGQKLRSISEAAGVTVHYMEDPDTPTGTCAVLITDKDRSLVANLAAANSYKISHLDTPDMKAVIDAVQFFYISGFFLTVSPDSALALGKHAAETNKTVLFNISAPFIAEFFTDRADAIIEYADVVFANETEAAAYGKKKDWGSDLTEVAKKLAELPKANTKRPRTVIFTQGSHSTLICTAGADCQSIPVEKIASELIIDTNGAGDSFCGGFLAQYINGASLETAVKCGHYVAGECIQRSGATYPEGGPKKSTF